MKNFLFGILATVLIVAVGLGAYIFGKRSPQSYIPSPIPSEIGTPSSQTSAPTAVPTPQDETETIKNLVKDGLVAEHGQDASQMTITVSRVEGNYAQGGASSSGGGGMWFAAKVAGVWKLVWDGNGVIYCSNPAPYPDFPKDMISECWDQAANKNVTR